MYDLWSCLQTAAKLSSAYVLKVTPADIQSLNFEGSEKKMKSIFHVAFTLSRQGRCCIVLGVYAGTHFPALDNRTLSFGKLLTCQCTGSQTTLTATPLGYPADVQGKLQLQIDPMWLVICVTVAKKRVCCSKLQLINMPMVPQPHICCVDHFDTCFSTGCASGHFVGEDVINAWDAVEAEQQPSPQGLPQLINKPKPTLIAVTSQPELVPAAVLHRLVLHLLQRGYGGFHVSEMR